MKEYRAAAGLAAITFGLAAAAGVAYGIRNDVFFVGALALLAVSLAWVALWVAAGRGTSSSPTLEGRTLLARVSWVVGLVLAVVLAVAAIVAG